MTRDTYEGATVTREDYEDAPASWYVRLGPEGETSRRTIEQKRTVIFDYSEDGELIGLEIV